jgi:hypothetical protein
MSTLVSRAWSFQSLTTRKPLYATLLWGDQSKSIRVLIDSGAEESFMDTTMVLELSISTQPLSIPMDVRAAGWALYWQSHLQYSSYQPASVRQPQ